MKKRQLPKHDAQATAIMNINCTLFLVIAITFGTFSIANAKRGYTTDFNNYYGTDGTERGTTLGSCITCHNTLDGKGYNPYGMDYLFNSGNYAAIEPLDSDGDGFDNITEIIADTFPGDPNSIPVPNNSPPVADAGSDQTINEGGTALLDGSGSYDPDGYIVSYLWSQTGGLPVTLSDTSAVLPTFSAPQVGPGNELLTFQLTVTDDASLQTTDTCVVTIAWINDPPVADAGLDQTVAVGVEVTLDGSNSSDPDGNIASYFWEQTGGTPVILSDTSAAQPTFSSPVVGASGESLTFQLTVTDSLSLEDMDTCIVNVTEGNQPPLANAGANQTVNEGSNVTLNGSSSSDPDGVITSYQWTQTSGPAVTMSNASAARPTFMAPDVGPGGNSLTFELTVTDDGSLQSTDTCIVNISWVNQPPIAHAGNDQTGAFSAEEGSTVMLDGTNSTDPDDGIATYLWVQTGTGPSVTLSNPTDAQPKFVTPVVDVSELTLSFRLTIEDNGSLQASDEVSVTIHDNGITGFPSDVLTMMCSEGDPIGVKEGNGGSLTELKPMGVSVLPNTSEAPQDLVYGLLDLQLKTDVPGGTATVVIYLPNPAPEGYKWYKYNVNTKQWTDYGAVDINGSKGAAFNAARDQITLTLVDNGSGDDDGLQNGIIADPSGLGAGSFSSSSIGSNSFGPGAGCFIAASGYDAQFKPLATLIFLGLLLVMIRSAAMAFLRRRR